MVCEFNSTGDIFRVEEVFDRGQCIMDCYFDIIAALVAPDEGTEHCTRLSHVNHMSLSKRLFSEQLETINGNCT